MANDNEYMREYMKRRYYTRRKHAIDLLGGRCAKCKTTKNLEFDHINPKQKKFAFAKIWNRKWDFFLKELEKAQLLCTRCHRAKTSGELGVPHGGGLTGKRNCTCSKCRKRKREYMCMNKHKWPSKQGKIHRP